MVTSFGTISSFACDGEDQETMVFQSDASFCAGRGTFSLEFITKTLNDINLYINQRVNDHTKERNKPKRRLCRDQRLMKKLTF